MVGCAWPLRRVSTLPRKSRRPDSSTTLSPNLEVLRKNLLDLVHSSHPVLDKITKHYFQQPSKQIRPLLILLFSQATNSLGKDWQLKLWESTHSGGGGCQDELDIPFSPPDILTDYNPRFPQYTERFQDTFVMVYDNSRVQRRPKQKPQATLPPTTPTLHPSTYILPTQLRLALIVEITHTASLLHDDVLDASTLRRGVPSAPAKFTNKLSLLSGNFMMARASAALARLGNPEVTRIMTRTVQNLIEGEILQMEDVVEATAHDDVTMRLNNMGRSQKYQDVWNTYLQKSYLKTASLMARGARSAVILGGCIQGEIWREIAYAYSRNLGIAFQLVDDTLDYESTSATLGKPDNVDLELGLTTAPVLYAWEEFPEMGELIKRQFKSPGDPEKARELVCQSSAISRTQQLAQTYADEAKNILQELPHSEARDMLEVLADYVVVRRN